MPKTRMLCQSCGSDNVSRDGLLRWNGEDWEKSCELDCMQCNDCGEEITECDVIPEFTVTPGTPADHIHIRLCIAADNSQGGITFDDETEMTLARFFYLNADGISLDEQRSILESLVRDGTFYDDDGASASWRIWAIPAEVAADV